MGEKKKETTTSNSLASTTIGPLPGSALEFENVAGKGLHLVERDRDDGAPSLGQCRRQRLAYLQVGQRLAGWGEGGYGVEGGGVSPNQQMEVVRHLSHAEQQLVRDVQHPDKGWHGHAQ